MEAFKINWVSYSQWPEPPFLPNTRSCSRILSEKSFPDLLFSNTPSQSTTLKIYAAYIKQIRNFCANNPLHLRKPSKEKKG